MGTKQMVTKHGLVMESLKEVFKKGKDFFVSDGTVRFNTNEVCLGLSELEDLKSLVKAKTGTCGISVGTLNDDKLVIYVSF